MVRSATVTTLFVPTFLLAKVAVAAVVTSDTVSFVSTPTNAAEALFNNAVADVVALYTRLLAVMPLTVRVFTVMLAVVVGWVSV